MVVRPGGTRCPASSHFADESFQSHQASPQAFWCQRRFCQPFANDGRLHQVMAQQTPYEIIILFTSGNQFGDGQVMNFRQSPVPAPVFWLRTGTRRSRQPAGRMRRFRADTVRIVKGLVKGQPSPRTESSDVGRRGRKHRLRLKQQFIRRSAANTAWLPVIPVAARMICSSCGRCMMEAGFDFPDFPAGALRRRANFGATAGRHPIRSKADHKSRQRGVRISCHSA